MIILKTHNVPNITKKANKKNKSVVYLIAAWEAGFKTAALKSTFISPAASSDLCFATLKMHTDQKKEIKGPTCMTSTDQKELVEKHFGAESPLNTN